MCMYMHAESDHVCIMHILENKAFLNKKKGLENFEEVEPGTPNAHHRLFEFV